MFVTVCERPFHFPVFMGFEILAKSNQQSIHDITLLLIDA